MCAPRTTWPSLLLVAAIYLLLAWPGADRRGVIAEEVTPYLPRYPVVLTATPTGVTPLPPHDSPNSTLQTPTTATGLPAPTADNLRPAPTDLPTPQTGLIRTAQWPNLAYAGEHRTWPLFIRGYQSALGTYVGLALETPLGGGITGIRRSSVLLGLTLVLLVAALARRLGLAPWSAALVCALSPGLLFFSRTGYGFELFSRVAMLLALVIAAPRRPLTTTRALLLAATITAAILSRATIVTTLLPALAVLLIHPQRWPGRRILLVALGFALPVFILLAIGLAFHTAPTARIALDLLAPRTLLAGDTLLAQLTWVTDPRTILEPLLTSTPITTPLWLALPGLAVFLLAAHRWWHARAGDGECMFLAAALGNALFGAWLYGDPQQFQLGMALEPLFAICLISQVNNSRPLLLAIILALRAHQTLDLLASERHTANPMLSGAAQRALVTTLESLPPAPIITTAYNHVGMPETWSQHPLPVIHAWRALRADDVADFPRTWTAILRDYTPRYIVLSVGTNLFEGPYTDLTAVRTGLDRALTTTGRKISARHTFPCESAAACLELLELE